MAPIKPHAGSDPPEVPDVRPVGIGECLRRTIHRAVIQSHKDALADHLMPQQVAVGVPSGSSLLAFGVRGLLELHPDWVVVKLDIRNAHNEVKRASILQRLLEAPSLRPLAPLFAACYGPISDVVLAAPGFPLAPFASEEGVQQGDGLATAGFCVGVHPEVCSLDAAVARAGGAARFFSADGHVVGPSGAVFPAIAAFAASILPLGLELREDKCCCFSPAPSLLQDAARPPQFPLGAAEGGGVRRGRGRRPHRRRRVCGEFFG